jgi:hypothetical protein
MRTRRKDYGATTTPISTNDTTDTNDIDSPHPADAQPTTTNTPPVKHVLPSLLSTEAPPFDYSTLQPRRNSTLSADAPHFEFVLPPLPHPATPPTCERPTEWHWNNDILFQTTHYLPTPPPGTYWHNNTLLSDHYPDDEHHNNLNGDEHQSINDNNNESSTEDDITHTIVKHREKQTFDHNGIHTIVNQNIHGISRGDDTKIKSLVHQMKQYKWGAI